MYVDQKTRPEGINTSVLMVLKTKFLRTTQSEEPQKIEERELKRNGTRNETLR